jgi:hypothetical protein
MSYYPVYLIEYLGAPRNHHAIFVEAEDDGSGTLFHVKGDIQTGMTYETRQTSKKPDLSNTFLSKSQLGWVSVENLSRVDSICRANPPPAKQFNGPKRINKNQPLRRCQEWTSETIGSLEAEGVLLRNTDSAAGGSSSARGSSRARHSAAGPSRSTEPTDGETRDGYWYWSAQYQRWYHQNDDGTYEWSPE